MNESFKAFFFAFCLPLAAVLGMLFGTPWVMNCAEWNAKKASEYFK